MRRLITCSFCCSTICYSDVKNPAQTPPSSSLLHLHWETEKLPFAAPGEHWKPHGVVFPTVKQLCPTTTYENPTPSFRTPSLRRPMQTADANTAASAGSCCDLQALSTASRWEAGYLFIYISLEVSFRAGSFKEPG